MNYKSKLFYLVNGISKLIKNIELVKLKPNTIDNLLELQQLYSKLLKLFIRKETLQTHRIGLLSSFSLYLYFNLK